MNLYASPTASISPGTLTNPTTLTDACMRAASGDTIHLSAGTYRGTYAPASGVILAGPRDAIISGLDVISGFVRSGIYYTTPATSLTPLNYSLGADQVFIGGVEVLESRWPAATPSTRGDISTWAEATAVSLITAGPNYEATYTVPGLPAGNLTDCRAHVLNGYQWITIAGDVIASSGDTITVRFPNDGNEYNKPVVGSRLYLWGGSALPPHGFHIAGGLLHLATNPGTSEVEVKVRHWGLDLRGRKNVTVRGITLQSCSIRTDDGSTGLTLESMHIYNLTHAQAPTAFWAGPDGHITLRGGSTIRNTVVQHCAGAFANVRGEGCVIDNIKVLDASYSGICQSALGIEGGDHTVSRSTLGMAGAQSLLDVRKASGCTIRGCEVYGGGGILTDGGTVMFANSQVTTDQGNRILESVIHDTRGRSGPQPHLYGNSGIYIEGQSSIHVSDCHIWGATSNDLQAQPHGGISGTVRVEGCTLGTLNLTYSGSASTIPVTYKDNIVGAITGEYPPAAVSIVGNYIDRQLIPGNTQASNIFATLDRGYPGPYTPTGCGARSDSLYYYGAYSNTLDYAVSADRDNLTGVVRVRLEGPPPPDGFTVRQGPTVGTVRQYIEPTQHLVATFPPSVTGLVDIELSAPGAPTKLLSVLVPGDLSITTSSGTTISGSGFIPPYSVRALVTITSQEESWDVPVPVPVDAYIAQGLMDAGGAGIITKEGLPLYVDPTYPVGGVHVWVRVPHIPVGISTFTLLLGGNTNVSNSEGVFLDNDVHLQEDIYTREAPDGMSVTVEGTDLVISGTTTMASKFGSPGIRLTSDYIFSNKYPARPFSWDTYLSMAPNTADYWWSVLGNNSFLLSNAGSTVTSTTSQPSTMGREFSRRLVSNVQLRSSMVWQEDLITISTRVGIPQARGMFTIMVGQERKAIDYRFHYIRARAVPESGRLPTASVLVEPSATRLWIDGAEYIPAEAGDSGLVLSSPPPLAPGKYDLRVLVDNGEEYSLVGGYVVGGDTTTTVPPVIPTPSPSPPVPSPPPTQTVPAPIANLTTTREVGFGPLSSRPPKPNLGQVYISYEGTCYASSEDTWIPYQVVDVSSKGEASPITGSWPLGTVLAKVGDGVLPSNLLPLAGGELLLVEYSTLYSVLGSALPLTDGAGVEGTSHFLLPNHSRGIVSIPGSMVVGFGGWVTHLPGRDYPLEWVVVST